MRFASREKAVISQFEVGAGFVPGGGPMARLPRLVGRGRATEILIGADDFNGELAEQHVAAELRRDHVPCPALNLLPRRDLLDRRPLIQRLRRIEDALGFSLKGARIYAKRDDLMSLGGGNQLPKLGFLLGDAAAAANSGDGRELSKPGIGEFVNRLLIDGSAAGLTAIR